MSNPLASMKENMARHLVRRADDPRYAQVQGAAHDGKITPEEARATLNNGFVGKAIADGFDAFIVADAAKALSDIANQTEPLALRRTTNTAEPRAATLEVFSMLILRQLATGSFSEADFLRLRRAAVPLRSLPLENVFSDQTRSLALSLIAGEDYESVTTEIDAALVLTYHVEHARETAQQIIAQLPASEETVAEVACVVVTNSADGEHRGRGRESLGRLAGHHARGIRTRSRFRADGQHRAATEANRRSEPPKPTCSHACRSRLKRRTSSSQRSKRQTRWRANTATAASPTKAPESARAG